MAFLAKNMYLLFFFKVRLSQLTISLELATSDLHHLIAAMFSKAFLGGGSMFSDSLVIIIIIGNFTVTSTVVGNISLQPSPPIGTLLTLSAWVVMTM